MDITILNDEELNIFLNEIPENMLRFIFINDTKMAQKLKGFRPNKAPKNMLIQVSFKLIKKEKNIPFIKFISKIYDNFLVKITKDEKELIKLGYPKSIAHSVAIRKNCNNNFFLIYAKLEKLDNDEIVKIKKDSEIVQLIVGITRQNTSEIMAEVLKKIKDNNGDTYNDLSKEISTLKASLNSFNKANTENDKEIKNLGIKIEDLKNSQNNFISNETLENKISEIEDKNTKYINESIKRLADNETIQKINNEIIEIKKKLEIIETKKATKENIISRDVKNSDYEEFSEYMHDNIYDVIDGIVDEDEMDILREYLMEVIYSNKPIICSNENSEILTNIIASCITGGNYYVLLVSKDCSDAELINKLESLSTIKNNKVVLIKNRINVTDSSFILDYIKNRPFNEKYIFEIMFDKEVYFMPIDYLNCFNFFFGKFKLKVLKNDYIYAYNFEEAEEKPEFKINLDYIKALESLDINLYAQEISNENFYGLLAYSVIPFVAINRGIYPSELVDKLIDDNVREKCEVVIHD